MTFRKTFAMTATAALLGATAAGAQMFGDGIGTDYDYNSFNTGMNESGYFNRLDRDQDTMLNQSEYATGLYRDFDRDRDLQITEDEFDGGNTRYFGDGYAGGAFTDYDTDTSGYIDQTEFRGFYDSGYGDDFTGLDGDADGMLNVDEYNTSLYNRADADQDQVLTIEEEGFFEGWFDGDDIDAEIESIGEVY